jgi:hypothetical protein
MVSWKQKSLPVLRDRSPRVSMIVATATIIGILVSALAPAVGLAADNSPRTEPGSVGIQILDVPTNALADPRAHQYIVDNLAPGEVIHRRIAVSNTTVAALHVTVYSAAATIAQGSFTGMAGHTADDLSGWTTVDRGSLNISAGGTATDIVTVTVPPTASPGERYAVVWAEVASPHGGNVTLLSRAGIRMYLSVGGTNPVTSFTVDTLTAAREPNGRPRVRAVVHNTGGRAVDLAGTLTMSVVTGTLTAGPYPAELGTTVAPGQSEPVLFILTDQVIDGPWNATVILRSGQVTESGQARITFPHAPGAATPVTAQPLAAGGGFGVVAVLIAVLALLLGLAALLIVRHRRGRGTHHPATDPDSP